MLARQFNQNLGKYIYLPSVIPVQVTFI